MCFIQFSRWDTNHINHCVHLDTFYLLQSTNSHNFGQNKHWGNPSKLIETRINCHLSLPCFVLYLTFKVRKTSNTPLCSYWYGLSFAINNCQNLVRVNLYGNHPKLIKTYLICPLPTPCSVLYSYFKVRHKSNRPLCSSWRVLSASINQ